MNFLLLRLSIKDNHEFCGMQTPQDIIHSLMALSTIDQIQIKFDNA